MGVIQLGRDVNLHVIPTDKFKTMSVAVFIRQPLTRENATKTALIAQVLRRGSAKYPDLQAVQCQTESLFGSIFDVQIMKKGEQQLLQFYMEFARQGGEPRLLGECLAFLSEMMQNPLVKDGGFDPSYAESEKENLRHNIASRMNNKAEYAKGRLLAEMCAEEPFGIYSGGYAEDIAALNGRNCYAHYERMLRESPIDIIVIGDADEGEIAREIEQAFDFGGRGGVLCAPPPVNPYEPGRPPREITEQMELTQGKICVGLRSDMDPVGTSFYQTQLAVEILGGGANAKLFRKIREQESLCYYINAMLYRAKGIVLVQSGVDAANFERVYALIGDGLEQMATGDISDEEMAGAQKSLRKKYKNAKDYLGAMMDFYLSQHMLSDTDTLDAVTDKIGRVRKADVQLAARRLYVDTAYFLS